MNVEQAVNEAIGSSPELARSEAATQEARWRQSESLSGFLPTLNLTANYLPEIRYAYTDIVFGNAPAHVPQIIPTANATLSLQVPIFDGLSNVNRYRGAGLLRSAADHRHDWARFQLEQDVRLKFYQALTAEKLEAVSRQNLATISDHFDQVTALKKGGVSTNYEVLRVEVQLNEAKTEVIRAQDDVYLARQRLAVAMGLSADAAGLTDERPLEGDIEAPEPTVIEKAKMPVPEARKDLVALEETVEASGKQHAASAAYLVPKISLGGQYVLYNNLSDGLTDYENYRAAWSGGVFLTWNLFDGMNSIARERQSSYARIQAEKQLDQARLQIPADFQFWRRRYLYNAALYRAKQSDVEKAEESVRLSKAGFRAGVRTNTEILDAELDLFRARAGLVNALMSSAEARLKLELATGTKLN